MSLSWSPPLLTEPDDIAVGLPKRPTHFAHRPAIPSGDSDGSAV